MPRLPQEGLAAMAACSCLRRSAKAVSKVSLRGQLFNVRWNGIAMIHSRASERDGRRAHAPLLAVLFIELDQRGPDRSDRSGRSDRVEVVILVIEVM
jgi:hypothetical protein